MANKCLNLDSNMPLKFWVSNKYEIENINGEDCRIIELEITKTDYINHNKRK